MRGSSPAVLMVALALGAAGCADMASSFELLTEGPPVVSFDEARRTDHRWFRVRGAVVRTDVLGHFTYTHGSRRDEQRFVARLARSADEEADGSLWVGCRETGEDVTAARARCLERMSAASPILASEDYGLFRQALEDAASTHGGGGPSPRVLRIARSPENEAAEDFIAPLVLLVVGAIAGLGAYVRARRRGGASG